MLALKTIEPKFPVNIRCILAPPYLSLHNTGPLSLKQKKSVEILTLLKHIRLIYRNQYSTLPLAKKATSVFFPAILATVPATSAQVSIRPILDKSFAYAGILACSPKSSYNSTSAGTRKESRRRPQAGVFGLLWPKPARFGNIRLFGFR